MTRVDSKRAATGAMTGLALGDALGFPTEFNDVPRILEKCGPWRDMALPAPAYVTDDTQMSLALGRGLRTAAERGPLTPSRVVRPVREEYVEWWRSPENNRAPGRTCLVACELLSHDERRWQEASQVGSKGCGATMRVAPVGLLPGLPGLPGTPGLSGSSGPSAAPGLSDEARSGVAQLQAALTHGHPTALAASDLVAWTIRLLAHGTPPGSLLRELRAYARENRSRYHEWWLGDLWRFAHDHGPVEFIERGWDECLDVLDRVEAALRAPDPEADPCEATGEGWVAEESLATALLCFLLFPEEPLTALRRAACTAGDSDSLACLTGAFAGAYLGAGCWPSDWAERIEYRGELLALGALWDA
ncbi:ADP-ribosylglycohydrolase family protein [Streptomyces albiaxialis]|uniref:ADP-ribosylglycohydrolase family protein n=1 Tax=Streptomyces albiaxialis TaxID=329523 RepID=A0ABN2VY95_9ACTN